MDTQSDRRRAEWYVRIRVCAELGHSEAWQMRRYNIGHLETAETRAEVLALLRRWL